MIPEIGKSYPFFDDGKNSVSRLYKATVTRVFKFSKIPEDLVSNRLLEDGLYTLTDYIRDSQSYCDWLYAPETDYVIEASIPIYDDDLIYFIRTKNNGWFSIDFSNTWQSGELDITWKKYNSLLEFYQEEDMWDAAEEIQEIMG